MKFPIKTTIALAVLGAIGYFAYGPIAKKIEESNKPRWRTVKTNVGTLKQQVSATGTVRPVKKVQIGSFVSGPIVDLFVEFNQEVKQNEVLARIDPKLFAANVARDKATLATAMADVQRVKALLQQARNDERRAMKLREKNKDFIAQSELDRVRFSRLSQEAQLVIAEAAVERSKATLTNSQTNLDYCEIRSPEDGMIIDRKVEPGQTLAAQFQTPELFVVGVGMREKMHIFADVDESEIGLIREAADSEQPVTFTVTAYPDSEFEGFIEEVRFSSAELQNVVTYPVVVGCPNPDLKLLPGMTADLSFQIRKRENVVKIPKGAIRFFPTNKEHVREQDQHLLDIGKSDSDEEADEGGDENVDDESNESPDKDDSDSANSNSDADDSNEDQLSTELADDESTNGKKKDKKIRHVWVVEGERLKAIEVKVGISDSRFWELVSGDVEKGMELVIGQKARGEE
ncbi:efflux RND transporter periplasmic adaptor subunit [Mariniblastus fucicola]|uniref:Macrolide export protein MacA n=1 Tax=Mariniblastus fucicola TaxID=980251 RepID=A0A5B9P2E5_9BACT|nr:efflux RND transporter periplasmic adaptor subunit [Mariniblastus fucicola]QEG20687.1 Macrolide export protein MacA [Mariniblastus fucicola]